MQETKVAVTETKCSHPLQTFLFSSIGKKILTGLSGLGLIGFIIVHLLGNLTLFVPGSDAFNAYAHKLHSLGPLLTVAELGLLFIFILHIVSAIAVTKQNKQARPEKYQAPLTTKGAPSKQTLSSKTMIISGLILLAFVVLHVLMFRFWIFVGEEYHTMLQGDRVENLHRLVKETFQSEGMVLLYCAAMIFLGFHLRHAFWSFFQSLGAYHPRYTPLIYSAGIFVAILLALGFFALPIWMYVMY